MPSLLEPTTISGMALTNRFGCLDTPDPGRRLFCAVEAREARRARE
jgi:hypothetical protein